MPTNNPTPTTDAELAELKRLHAAATPGQWRMFYGGEPLLIGSSGERVADMEYPRDAEWVTAAHNALPAILDHLEAVEREREELEAELEEERAHSIEYEKDCTKALCSLAREFDFEWDGDGATADELREFISETVGEAEKIRNGLAARDARMKREGAAEWLRGYIIAVKLQDPMAETVWLSALEQAAQRLREGK